MKEKIQEAGAIVLKMEKEEPEVLLILSKKEPKVRIFPKGHLQEGESLADAASRELLEETGIKGKFIREVGSVEYVFRSCFYHVTYFLFHYLEKVDMGEDGRDPRWFFWQDAINLLSFKELRELLKKVIGEEKKVK
ncbi:MAG: NUDIX domain-containing protein [Chitinispirillaceae bacterium]|nr:NUDIX domain-containing protein [Chitinispirillaceae bacterium]